MSSNFEARDSRCEGRGCSRTDGAVYRVEEKQTLCDDCASQKGCAVKERKGGENWLCDKHKDRVEGFCKNHDIGVCRTCATFKHKNCEVEEISDIIPRKTCELKKILSAEKAKRTSWRVRRDRIQKMMKEHMSHFHLIKGKVTTYFDDAITNYNEKESDEVAGIHRQLEEDIRKLTEESQIRVQKCRVKGQKRRGNIEEKRRMKLKEIAMIADTVKEKEAELISECDCAYQQIDTMIHNVDELLQNYPELVKVTNAVMGSLTRSPSAPLSEDVTANINDIVKSMTFIERPSNLGWDGRVCGFPGKLELINKIMLPEDITRPHVAGLISESTIGISCWDTYDFYETNLKMGTSRKVIEGGDDTVVVTCQSLNEDTIVCGKWCGRIDERKSGYISVYDRYWTSHNIPIQSNASQLNGFSWFNAAVTRCCRILAAEEHQRNVYIIDPVDKEIVETFNLCKEVKGRIQATKSGEFLVRTSNDEISVFSQSGNLMKTIQNDGWDDVACMIDAVTDTLYVSYTSEEKYAVDQVSIDGTTEARRILELPSPGTDVTQPTLVTISGNLIVCHGQEILVYKNKLTL